MNEWYLRIPKESLPQAVIEAAEKWFGINPVVDPSRRRAGNPSRTPLGRRAQRCVAFLLFVNGIPVSMIRRVLNVTSQQPYLRDHLLKTPVDAENEGWFNDLRMVYELAKYKESNIPER